MIKIFYSWQSTTDGKYNRYFIENCIDKAIKKIKKIPEFSTIRFELQEGITGEAGAVPVADTITDERIPSCDIFIADLSVVNWVDQWKRCVKWAIGDKYKPMQNNNVIFEYGIAKNAIGVKQIIGVLNNAYGSPCENPDNIPFDIRHLRFPLDYNYSSRNVIEKQEVKRKFISNLAKSLILVIQEVLINQKNKFRPFVIWNEWGELLRYPHPDTFIENDRIQEVKNSILNSIKQNTTKPIRLLGLSGLGKTRILYEVFRPEKDNDYSLVLTNRLLYIDLNDYENTSNLPSITVKIKSEKPDAILILDNCTSETHKLFQKHTSDISFISVNSNPEEVGQISNTAYINISKTDLDNVVNKLIDNTFGDLEEYQRKTIKDFSQGIPLMVVLLGESLRNGEKFLGRFNDKELLDKLLGRKIEQLDWKTMLKSCSLFNYFGFEDELGSQYQFIATSRKLTVSNSDAEVRKQTLLEACNYYLKREIFERHGRYLKLRPMPLAIYLAEEWLDNCSSDRLYDVIAEIEGLKEPHKTDLTNSFAKQMRYLEYNDSAKRIVEKLVGINGPFDNAGVLNTELGSRLFRSFAEVNPIAVSQNLSRLFLNKTTNELLQVEEGRRNLVWALEKLCFIKDTFSESAKVLYVFAVAENETWSNNAKGQLRQLFHILLPGTEADLKERWAVIEWGLNRNDELFTEIALELMNSGLNSDHFHRGSGAEEIGTRRLKDYSPTDADITEYWNKILSELTEIIKQESKLSEEASEIIANNIRPVFHRGYGELIIPYIREIVDIKNKNWDKGLKGLKHTLYHGKEYLSEEFLTAIEELMTSLTKTDFLSRSFASTHYDNRNVKWSSEEFKQGELKRMEGLAKEFVETDISWESTLSVLYKRTNDMMYNQYMYDFGTYVYKYIEGDIDRINNFIDTSLEIFVAIGKDNVNLVVLGGFLKEAEQNIKDRFYDLLYDSEDLSSLLFYFVSNDSNGIDQINRLFELIDNRKCELGSFILLKYRSLLQSLEEDCLVHIKTKLFSYGKEGYILAFGLFVSIEKNDNLARSQFINLTLKECVLELGINYNNKSRNNNHDYEYIIFIIDVLNNSQDNKFAEFIIKSIIDTITWHNSYHLDHDIKRICEVLVQKYFKTIWPYLSQALLGENDEIVKYEGLKKIFGSRIGWAGRNVGLLFDGDIELIIQWCYDNKPLAPIRIAGLVPIFDNKDGGQWYPFTRRLIDEFGDIEGVLRHIGHNVNSHSWSGSLIPLLKSKNIIFESILDHPKLLVSEWAREELAYIRKRIEVETNRDAEMCL